MQEKQTENIFKIDECNHIISVNKNENLPPLEKGNLFLGGRQALAQKILNFYKISVVLTIIDSYSYLNLGVKDNLSKLQLKQSKWIDLEDDPEESITPFLQESLAFIKNALQENNVLVHCAGGRSRSASIVIAFVMKQFNKTYREAKKYVTSKRNVADPNQGFEKELLRFEEILQEKNEKIQSKQ